MRGAALPAHSHKFPVEDLWRAGHDWRFLFIAVRVTLSSVRPQFLKDFSVIVGRFGHTTLNLILPPQCPITGEAVTSPGVLGASGWAQLDFIDEPFCNGCGAPFATFYGDDVLCPSRIMEPPLFDRARAVVLYNDAARRLVPALKFSDRLELAEMFGAWMARAGGAIIDKDSLIIPVPLHWRRLMSRRFNQSAMLADEISKRCGARTLLRGLKRIRATPPQKEIPSIDGRRRNVAGAFAINENYRRAIKGANIVLVDDVLTTGATVSACASVLKRGGASQVDVLVLARVVKGDVGAI